MCSINENNIANVSAKLGNDGIYYCPKCNSKLQRVYDYHYDHMYRLQCPVDREHCYPKNDVSDFEAEKYDEYPILRCKVCNFVLRFDRKSNTLICPVDRKHQASIECDSQTASKDGYEPYSEINTTAKNVYEARKTNPKATLNDVI